MGRETIPELLGARSLMCTKLGVELMREQVVEPFGFVMIRAAEHQAAVDKIEQLQTEMTTRLKVETGALRDDIENLRAALRELYDAIDAIELRVRGDEVVALNDLDAGRRVAEAMHAARDFIPGRV